MRRILLAACGAMLVGMAAGSAAGVRSDGPTPASVDAAMQAIWTKYHDQANLLGLCVGAVDQGVTGIKCFGPKGPNSSDPLDEHTLFHIASISKTFGATLLALRVQQGKVALEDQVRDLVPNLAARALFPLRDPSDPSKPGLTLLDLAQHYSGLPHGTPHAKNVDAFLFQTGVCFQSSTCRVDSPGAHFHYSNWGVSVLGMVLALRDGFPDTLVGPWVADNRQSITDPLGMKETRSWQDWLFNDPGHFFANRAVPGTEKFKQSPYESPGSGIYSSPHDMLIWLRYSMGLVDSGDLGAARPLLYDTTPYRRAKKKGQKIGLVWTLVPTTNKKGLACVSKAGDGNEFHAFLIFVEKKRGVFLLVNRTPTISYRTIATDLLNSLPSAPGTTPPHCPLPGSGDDG